MIKLVIEINEEKTLKVEDFTATSCHINISEYGRNPSVHEKKISNILKDRLNVQEKIELEGNKGQITLTKGELKRELEKILKRL